MSLLEIIEWPAQVLETRAMEVKVFDDELRSFVKAMHDTMDAAPGIGLAANQVNDLRRLLVIYIPFQDNRYKDQEDKGKREPWHDKRFTFINPAITKRAGKIRWQEGCLSFPEIFEMVDRSAEVWVTAQDEFGKTFEVHATALFAVCLQHEIDHIDGIVFFNRMSRLKASMVKKRMLRRGSQLHAESSVSVGGE